MPHPLIIFLFLFSGATALVYEVVWSKYLSLMFGSTVQAQTVVLAVFMGGLALGNRIFGKRADRAENPLAMYGYIELAIGLYAFGFPYLHSLGDIVFISVGRTVLEVGPVLLLLKLLLSALLLLGPTILMGGTLPLIAAWLHRQSADAGRASARFYAINSLGAVAGSGIAGFYLVQTVGLVSSLQVTALFNLLIGVTAVAIGRTHPLPAPVAPADTQPSTDTSSKAARSPDAQLDPAAKAKLLRVGSLVVATTGAVSMGLEVLASRSLVLIFGASLQAFAIVLMAFILGIGLGSSVVASPGWRRLKGVGTTVTLMLAAATVVGVLVMGLEHWVEFYLQARMGLAANETGFIFHQMLAAGLAMAVIGLPAGLLGAVLPLWIRTLSAHVDSLGDEVGRLLTWNTLGAVIGVMMTGFVLMPWLGLRGSFFVLVTCLCVAAAMLAQAHGRKGFMTGSLAVGVALLLAASVTGESWREVLGSGAFRFRGQGTVADLLEIRRQGIKLLFYEDAADATVSVERIETGASKGVIGLRINGKADASSEGDLATQYLLAHLPMAARPEAKNAFVLGVGSGITAGALLGHPLESITVAENTEPVVRAAKFFEPWNHGVLTNSRARIWIEDARTILKLSPQTYDVIISEPSNPWMAGVGSVFSREFYQLAASRLSDDGIMAQWFHIYEMNDGIVEMVIRTFASVFPHMEIWDPGEGDIIMLGAMKPWRSSADSYAPIFDRPVVKQDLAAVGIESPAALWARQLASQRTAFAIPGRGAIQSDLFPVLEYAAPKVFYIGATSTVMFKFDERTWHHWLSEPEKKRALAGLDDATLEKVLNKNISVNRQLRQVVRARVDTNGKPAEVPSVFWKTSWPPYRLPDEGINSTTLNRLIAAENQIHANPANWQAAADEILTVLTTHGDQPENTSVVWSPGHFATLAASLAMTNGDVDRATKLIELGLKLEPDHKETAFLFRVLNGERLTDLMNPRN